MTGKRWRLKVLGLAAGCVAVAVGWTYAQRGGPATAPQTLIPANSIMFARIDGSQLHEEAYRKTAAWQALEESGLSVAFLKVLANDAWPAEVKEIFGLVRTVQRNGLWISVAVDPPAQGPVSAWGVTVIPGGGEYAEIVEKLLLSIAEANGERLEINRQRMQGREVRRFLVPGAPVEVGWWAEGGNLLLAYGMNAVQSALATASGERPNVTTNPLYAKYPGSAPAFEANSVSWLDFASLRKMFGDMPLPVEGDQQVTVNAVLSQLGLENLNHVASVSGFRGKSLWSEVVVDAPGPRKGLLSLMDQPSFAMSDLPPIPVRHGGVAAQSFHWKNAYDALLGVARTIAKYGPPDAGREIDNALEQAEEELGFKPEKLLSSLGTLHVYYTDSLQSGLSFGGVGMISVANAGALKECLEDGFETLVEAADEELEVESTEKNGATIYTLTMPQAPIFAPVVAVTDKWLLVALSPQAVEAEMLRMSGKLPKWDPATAITGDLAALPKKYTAVTIMDPREFLSLAIGAAPSILGFAELAIRESGNFDEDFDLGISPADIPPAEVVISPLFPNVVISVVDANGARTYMQQSLPGIPLSGGGSPAASIGTIGVLTALLLPAVQQSREAARRAQSKNNLKQILLALHNYHDVMGSFPRGTVENKDLKEVDERLSWLVSILPYIDQAGLYNVIDQKSGFESEKNKEAMGAKVLTYMNPALAEVGDEFGVTHYIGIGGLGADGPKLAVDNAKAGMFGYDRVTNLRDVRDGTSNTLAVTESSELNVGPWGQGGKATIRPFTEKPYINGPDGIGSPHPGGMNAAFADGSVRFLSTDTDPAVIEALATIRGGEVVGDF